MASVLKAKSSGEISRDLALEMLKKLQEACMLCNCFAGLMIQVLEDYVLQIIQLKDGMNTLGNEVARLKSGSVESI